MWRDQKGDLDTFLNCKNMVSLISNLYVNDTFL